MNLDSLNTAAEEQQDVVVDELVEETEELEESVAMEAEAADVADEDVDTDEETDEGDEFDSDDAEDDSDDDAEDTEDEEEVDPRKAALDKLMRVNRLTTVLHRERAAEHGPAADAMRGQGRVLALLQMKDGISTRDMANVLAIRPSSLNETLARLERDGLIERKQNEADKRQVLTYLTDAGRAQDTRPEQLHDKLFADFTDEELEQFAAYLDRLNTALEAELPEDARERMERGRKGEEEIMGRGGFRGGRDDRGGRDFRGGRDDRGHDRRVGDRGGRRFDGDRGHGRFEGKRDGRGFDKGGRDGGFRGGRDDRGGRGGYGGRGGFDKGGRDGGFRGGRDFDKGGRDGGFRGGRDDRGGRGGYGGRGGFDKGGRDGGYRGGNGGSKPYGQRKDFGSDSHKGDDRPRGYRG